MGFGRRSANRSPCSMSTENFHFTSRVHARASSGAVGSKVKRWKVGDEVVVHCNQDDGDDEECNGGDPMFSASQRIWGYETPDGSFAQFCRVQDRQLMTRPKHLTSREKSAVLLHPDPGDGLPDAVWSRAAPVASWRQRFGLGRFGRLRCVWRFNSARRLAQTRLEFISDETKRDYVMRWAREGVINRTNLNYSVSCQRSHARIQRLHGGGARASSARRSGTSQAQDVDVVFEHPGEQTFPASCFVVKRGGMVVFCAGATGFHLTFDARFVWMRQKQIQGCALRQPEAGLRRPTSS